MVIAAIIGIASVATGVAGAVSQANSQNEARSNNEAYLKQQFEQDKKSYQYNWEESLRNYEHIKAQIAVQRAQEETIASLKDRMAVDEYKYNLAIRDYDYLNNLKQYKESERRYSTQRQFNNLAASLAQQSEEQRLREIYISAGFDFGDMSQEFRDETQAIGRNNQQALFDLQQQEKAAAFDGQSNLIKMIQEEGLQRARGVTGKSADRATSSVLAEYGRQQAMLAESLVSAESKTKQTIGALGDQRGSLVTTYGRNIQKLNQSLLSAALQSQMNRQDIALSKYGADLTAEANRMLMPTQGPEHPAPYATPRGTFFDPLMPRKGPAPVKGVNTVQGASPLGIVAGVAGGIASGFDTYSGLRAAQNKPLFGK